jgi:hypothetical protein
MMILPSDFTYSECNFYNIGYIPPSIFFKQCPLWLAIKILLQPLECCSLFQYCLEVSQSTLTQVLGHETSLQQLQIWLKL